MTWTILIHPKAVKELSALPMDMKAKLTRLFEIIQEVGPLQLREPHAKSLGHKLMELRITGRDGISRVIYALVKDKRVAILHAFMKKTQKTPVSTIECALKRLEEIEP